LGGDGRGRARAKREVEGSLSATTSLFSSSRPRPPSVESGGPRCASAAPGAASPGASKDATWRGIRAVVLGARAAGGERGRRSRTTTPPQLTQQRRCSTRPRCRGAAGQRPRATPGSACGGGGAVGAGREGVGDGVGAGEPMASLAGRARLSLSASTPRKLTSQPTKAPRTHGSKTLPRSASSMPTAPPLSGRRSERASSGNEALFFRLFESERRWLFGARRARA